jgi:hypothetical protein
METEIDWGVFVNEISIFATRQGIGWWVDFLARYERTGRMVCLAPTTSGNLWHVACDSKDDAELLALMMIEEHGLPKCAVKAKRLAHCQHMRTV